MERLKQLRVLKLWNNYKSEQIDLENKAGYGTRTWRRSLIKSMQRKTSRMTKGMAKQHWGQQKNIIKK
jgi:hypothetical protein